MLYHIYLGGEKYGPLLAIAIRGPFAKQRWMNEMGVEDPELARKINPRSLMALYGGERLL